VPSLNHSNPLPTQHGQSKASKPHFSLAVHFEIAVLAEDGDLFIY